MLNQTEYRFMTYKLKLTQIKSYFQFSKSNMNYIATLYLAQIILLELSCKVFLRTMKITDD